MFKLLKIISKAGTATVKYPFAPLPLPDGFRGKPEHTPEQCIACAACTIACPANAISMQTDTHAGTRTWSIHYGRCIFCGRCEEVCPTKAIALSPEFELAVANKQDLIQEAVFKLQPCTVCGTPFAPAKEVDYVIGLMGLGNMPPEHAQTLRARFSTCPDCKRAQTVVSTTGVAAGFEK